MSDPIPRDDETDAGAVDEEAGKLRAHRMPPEGLPEELIQRRVGRLDTRRALADLCKNIPGLDEVLLPRGIQADALMRKTGGSAQMARTISRKILQDTAAWGAFRTAVQEQIPPETFDAVEDLSEDRIEELAGSHTTESLLLAALSSEQEPKDGVIEALIEAWRDEHQRAEKKASEDALVQDLTAEIERLKKENEQLSFTSRTANERAAALAEEVAVLTGEREGASALVRRAEERAASALDLRSQLDGRIAELERRGANLERALESERKAYSTAAVRVEEMHEELGRVAAERDRIQNALENARFTDEGFGELLVRAVKNEVVALPNDLESANQTARLLEFMGKVLHAHNDLRSPGTLDREPRKLGSRTGKRRQGEDSDESESSPAGPAPPPMTPPTIPANGLSNGLAQRDTGVPADARTRPTLSFRALGGAGEVGGSSHLLDFGRTRVLVDAGIKPDGRGPASPDFGSLDGLDAAVITHAHLDHCGALPVLVRDRPDLPIYCTPPSARLIIAARNDHAAMGGGLPGGAPIHEVGKRLVPVPF
ncbi:MAG TPA: MBL fold metallo-hydrolase, partial [Rubrobacteraceae bacterium]|nr:MBL fold metallo-hydrolase [Rubrobacteraceae bacterium]